MRGLSTRNVRPCVQHSKFSFSTPSIRRTTFPPLQRALTCADAFLLFLPSVLTAALVVDYTGKQRQRTEWDRQIALAQEEADRLKQRQLESWSRLQRRSVSYGAWQQRRTLFTASHALQFVDEEREEMMDPLNRRDEINALDADANAFAEAEAEAEAKADTESQVDPTTHEHVKKQERFGRLIATRLALELMLRLRRARSPLYKPQPTVDTTDKTFYQSMDYIVQELNKVLHLLQALEIQKVPWDIKMPAEYREKQHDMAHRLLDLSDQYRRAEIHLPDFVMSYVQLVTDFKIGLPNYGYVVMMRAMAFKQEESQMARHVEDAIFDNHEMLDIYTVSNVIYHHGNMMDSVRFNRFLERITRADHHPRPHAPWYRLNVDDIDVCVPKTKNGHVITSLIRSALMCRQQTVAEAYATLFVDRDRIEKYSGVHKWFIIGSFLQSYGNWSSWRAGQKWLQAVLDWVIDLATADHNILGRVILRMLDFCVACGKKEDYEAIMSAVVAAHLQLPVVESGKNVKISQRMGAIRLDWSNRMKTLSDFDPIGRDRERAEIFKSMLNGRWTSRDKSDESSSDSSNSKWTEPGTIGYRPFFDQDLAAKRLKEVSKQRQLEVNHGFKDFRSSPKEVPFLELEDQKSLSQELGPENTSSESPSETSGLPFYSPFFQPVQETKELNTSTSTISVSDPAQSSDFSPDIAKVIEDLEATKKRIREVERQRANELDKLRRELEVAQAVLEKANVSTSTSKPLYNDDDWVKSSATG